jgi:hypothetical protein
LDRLGQHFLYQTDITGVVLYQQYFGALIAHFPSPGGSFATASQKSSMHLTIPFVSYPDTLHQLKHLYPQS